MKLPIQLFTLSFFSLTVVICLGQEDYKQPVEVNFDPLVIKASGIRSVIVYAEKSNENKQDMLPSSGKVSESEFDDRGNLTYMLTASSELSSFLTYKKDCVIAYYRYDDFGRKTFIYSEGIDNQHEVTYQYDEAGNVIEAVEVKKGDTIAHVKFHWTAGRMLRAEIEGKSDSRILFDELGRVTLNEHDDFRTTYAYTKKGDTITTKMVFSEANKVLFGSVTAKLISSNRLIFHKTENEFSPMNKEISARYDKHGNVVSYSALVVEGASLKAERSPFESERLPSLMEPLIYEIENAYDAKGLLTKRVFYSISKGNKVFYKTERFIYESEPLADKFPKDFLKAEREMEEKYKYPERED
jgi:hypothetical protein